MTHARRVADRLTSLMAVALGLSQQHFARVTDHSTADTLRVNHYRTAPGDAAPLPGQLGMGEHSECARGILNHC